MVIIVILHFLLHKATREGVKKIIQFSPYEIVSNEGLKRRINNKTFNLYSFPREKSKSKVIFIHIWDLLLITQKKVISQT